MVNDDAFSVHWAIAYSVGIAVIFLSAILGYKLSKKSDNPQLLKHLLLLTVVSLLTMLIVMTTKEIMCRPRFRFVRETGNPDFFKNWWQSGKEAQKAVNLSVANDEFSSFPSGHSAYAMFAVFLFPALAVYFTKFAKYRVWLLLVGFLWWGLTAFSWMTVGAHYLTDVCTAGLITILSYELVVFVRYILSKTRKKENSDSFVITQE